jgi:PAS domain S-box-containing protein
MTYDMTLLRECCKDETAFARLLQHLQTECTPNSTIVAELQLKAEERYQRLVELQPDVICAYTPDTRFTFANRAYCEYFGYALSEIMGKPLLDIVPQEILESTRQHIARLIETKQPIVYEREVKHANGEWRWLQWSDRPILDERGNIVEIQAVGRDITARKQTELNLRMLMDSMPRTALIAYNQHKQIVAAEGKLVDLIGFTPDVFIGRAPSEMFSGEYLAHVDYIMNAVLAGNELEFEYEFMERTMLIQNYPVRQGGEVVGGMGVIEDITDRKSATQQKYELALERERVQLITDFITNTQHEFRTPLSIMESSLYIAERTDNPEKRLNAFQKIRKQIQGLARLIDGLVMMSRLDAGVDVSEFHNVNLNYVARFAIAELTTKAEAKEITLESQIDENMPSITGHHQYLVHALTHLLDNAIRHTPDGGMIMVRTHFMDNRICIEVADTGEGIDPVDLQHIFERFYRNDKAHTTPGFGLGLPIAQKIANMHGGILSVSSTLEVGSVFTLTIPYESKA